MKGARGPRQSPRTLISLLVYHRKGIFEQQKCKGFLHRVCEAFFREAGLPKKTARNGVSGHLSARNARPRRAGQKKGAAGMICRADTRKRLNGEVWRTRRSAKVNSYRPAFPGRSIFAAGAGRAHRSFAPHLRSLCRLWRQQPTGLTLPSGAGRAGSLRPWAQTFLKHPAKKIGVSRAFPTHDSRCRRCPACRGRRRRRGGSIRGAGAGEARKGAARRPTG